MWPFSSYPECSPSDIDGKTYDYIVIGGGTAGCVIASRLSEDPNVTVLVLEKGGVKDNLVSRVPLLSQNFFLGDPLQVLSTRWSEPMTGANGRKNQLWTVEGMGGNSRINAMLWTRGVPGDYASWAEMGLRDWSWENVEPYFRKMENATAHPDSILRGHTEYLKGPVELRKGTYPFRWTSYIEKAAQNMGLTVQKDSNGPAVPPNGFFPLDVAINQRGERVSAFSAYLNRQLALQRRKHLTICTGALVSRLDLDGQKGVVRGVHVQPSQKTPGSSSRNHFVAARREVIICSGAISTPQILGLSGIGPKTMCQNLGMPIIKELPAVGAKLADHCAIPLMLEVPKKETIRLLESIHGLWHFLLWLVLGKGLMGTTSVLSAIFLQTESIDEKTMQIKTSSAAPGVESATERNGIPDIEIMIIPLSSLERDVPNHSLFSLYPTLVQPYSFGHVEVVERDPSSNPRITHPMFLDERDIQVARRAVRFTMRLAEEFQNSGYPYPAPLAFAPGNRPQLLSEWEKSSPHEDSNASHPATISSAPVATGTKSNDIAGAEVAEKTWRNVTDDEINDYMRRVAHTAFHFSCTCPMSDSEETGVVDERLRVYGFRNLRIADASVFPVIPSGHTMAPVMMVAERCADFVKDTWKETAN
ncbi:hypothetical protein F4818DRAFT_454661 [Hypoxylon cercidicola]|nr:hypothetical protein F4818DRAFT_454661 [Hypoxylon cercidicola]